MKARNTTTTTQKKPAQKPAHAAQNAAEKRIAAKARETADKLAKSELFIDTLDERGRDGLDFHDCGVVGIRKALEAAYRAGLADGLKAGSAAAMEAAR